MGCTSSWVYYPVAVLKSSLFLGMKWEKYNPPHYTCPTSSADSFCSLDFPLLLTLVAFVEHLASIACVAPQVYTQRTYPYYMEALYCVVNS